MPPVITLPSHREGIGVLLFGLECRTTAIIFRELLAANADVRLLCLPGRHNVPVRKTSAPRSLPMSGDRGAPDTAAGIARSSGIEHWRLGDLRTDEVQTALNEVEADLIVVACYHQLLPAYLYSERRLGGINVHPSLLPDKRGPDPLFWVFRDGDRRTGATVHRLTDRFDGGAILDQAAMELPDGISEAELESSLASIGASQVISVISGMQTGELDERPQDDKYSSWAPHPQQADFVLDSDGSARQAFNFVRGIEGRGHPLLIQIDGTLKPIRAVHSWSANSTLPENAPPDARAIPFEDGWLIASLWD